MARALVFALFSTFASLAQDSVSVFKIRPPELLIEGLFCNDYAITEDTKTMYYLTYEGMYTNSRPNSHKKIFIKN